MKKKICLVFIVLSLLVVFNSPFITASGLLSKQELKDLNRAEVVQVIDGDTVKLETGESVRLIGLDTPELNPPTGPIEYYGLQAKKFTKDKLLGQRVYLEYGAEKFDEYDRTLAYIYLADGTLFNAQLLEEGYAQLLAIAPNLKYLDYFKKEVKTARRNKRGLWQRRNLGLPIISWQEADDYMGEEVIVTGEVVATYDTGEVTFLNFARNYDETFSAVIFASAEHKFAVEAEDYFLDQQVWIRGEVKEHQGVPEIIIKEPTQIKSGEE
ncbi:MAG: thermonuclease family protein [Halanaerobacter sp.]